MSTPLQSQTLSNAQSVHQDDEFDEHYGKLDFGYCSDDFDVFLDFNFDILQEENLRAQPGNEDSDSFVSTELPENITTQTGATVIGELQAGAVMAPALTNLLAPTIDGTSERLPPLDHLSEPDRSRIQGLLQKFSGLFTSDIMAIGTIPGITHHIPTGNALPTVTRQWRLPQTAPNTICEQCDAMAKAGVIEPSTSPWFSPVVLVIDDLHQSCIFTSLEARSEYWAIPVEPRDRPKTAFSDGARVVIQLHIWTMWSFLVGTGMST
ncbi:uncharacterized protein LOC122254381 [Penaeus japonicus]|uniref:uncharacterized protein LOC122254381 n=1 Tax=Penaeus japonicus TaxID=27405 RepID=UPI001C714731|nr:uncharacterized protein LOC122254381 [Penaeus japonicus]